VDWLTKMLLMMIFGVIFYEIRNIRTNHLESIYGRLTEIEKQVIKILSKLNDKI